MKKINENNLKRVEDFSENLTGVRPTAKLYLGDDAYDELILNFDEYQIHLYSNPIHMDIYIETENGFNYSHIPNIERVCKHSTIIWALAGADKGLTVTKASKDSIAEYIETELYKCFMPVDVKCEYDGDLLIYVDDAFNVDDAFKIRLSLKGRLKCETNKSLNEDFLKLINDIIHHKEI